jgi:hypothetical protein
MSHERPSSGLALKMNLLPKAADEFRNREYWDKFFDKVGHEAFEWFVKISYLYQIRMVFLF